MPGHTGCRSTTAGPDGRHPEAIARSRAGPRPVLPPAGVGEGAGRRCGRPRRWCDETEAPVPAAPAVPASRRPPGPGRRRAGRRLLHGDDLGADRDQHPGRLLPRRGHRDGPRAGGHRHRHRRPRRGAGLPRPCHRRRRRAGADLRHRRAFPCRRTARRRARLRHPRIPVRRAALRRGHGRGQRHDRHGCRGHLRRRQPLDHPAQPDRRPRQQRERFPVRVGHRRS